MGMGSVGRPWFFWLQARSPAWYGGPGPGSGHPVCMEGADSGSAKGNELRAVRRTGRPCGQHPQLPAIQLCHHRDVHVEATRSFFHRLPTLGLQTLEHNEGDP